MYHIFFNISNTFKCFTAPTDGDRIFAWEPRRLLEESNKQPDELDNSLALKLTFIHNRKLLQRKKVSYKNRTLVNVFIAYGLHTYTRDLKTDFILEDCLLGAVKLTKNANKYKNG